MQAEALAALERLPEAEAAADRALAADPEVLILDDPTTGLDSVTQADVVAAVAALRADKTTVVITGNAAWQHAGTALEVA